MRINHQTDFHLRRHVVDILVNGVAVEHGTILCADDERGFVEKILPVPSMDGQPPFRPSAHGFPIVECLTGKVEIVFANLGSTQPA